MQVFFGILNLGLTKRYNMLLLSIAVNGAKNVQDHRRNLQR